MLSDINIHYDGDQWVYISGKGFFLLLGLCIAFIFIKAFLMGFFEAWKADRVRREAFRLHKAQTEHLREMLRKVHRKDNHDRN